MRLKGVDLRAALHLRKLVNDGEKLAPPAFTELALDPRQIHACVAATCGRPPDNRLMTFIDDGFRWETVDFKKNWTTEIQPRARKAYELEARARERGAELVRGALEIAKPLAGADAAQRRAALAHPIVRLVIYLKTLSDLGGVEGLLSEGPDGKMIVDEDVLEGTVPEEDERAYLRVILEKQLIPVYSILAVTEPIDRILQRHDGLLESRLRYLYPNDGFAGALVSDASAASLRIQKIFAEMGPVANLILSAQQRDLVERAAKPGGDLTVPEMGEYLQIVSLTEMLEIVLFHLPAPPAERAVTAIDELVTIVRGRQAAVPSLAPLAEAEKFCRGRLNLMEATEQSAFRLRRFENLIPAVKESVIENARRVVAPEQMPALAQRIAGLQFFLPRGPRNSTVGFRRHLESTIESQEKTLDFYGTPEARDVILWIEIVRAISGADAESRAPELASFCQNLPVEPSTDATNPRSGRISLSWFTINYPDVGVGIMAHEIGHAVSGFIRGLPKADAFTESLSCVARRNPFGPAPAATLGLRENTRWSEEDWADRFSAWVVSDLRARGQLAPLRLMNLGCALVGVDREMTYGGNRLTPGENDPHSSGLLRLLMIANDLGKLHPDCAPLMANFAGKELRCE